jgi:hypothetical protein
MPTTARRRALLTPLLWVFLAGLTGFMVCIATGVIPSRVAVTGNPEAFVPRKVDETQGWGTPSSYTGRYDIRPSASATGSDADGTLTLFLRAEPGDPLVPSGQLGLHTASGNTVGYLTDLKTDGTTVRATIRGGAFEGPVIGSLTASAPRNGTFQGTIKAPGVGTVEGDFVRVAKAPKGDYAQAQDLNLP